MVKAKNNSSDSDTVTTIMSGIPAHMAVQERQQQPINELEAVVQSNSRNCGGGRGGGSGGSGRSWRQEAGGRRQEAGGRRQEAGGGQGGSGSRIYRPKSDGPLNRIKTGQYYGNDNHCWSHHGYDVAKNHDSKTCECKWRHANHQEAATGANPMGGSPKDKEFSKMEGLMVLGATSD
jgi:hypothetical protein